MSDDKPAIRRVKEELQEKYPTQWYEIMVGIMKDCGGFNADWDEVQAAVHEG